nr:hypothetical protein [Tanacetum cinerariifolium]
MRCSTEFIHIKAFAANEDTTANVWKRKKTHSPLVTRAEEALSCRTVNTDRKRKNTSSLLAIRPEDVLFARSIRREAEYHLCCRGGQIYMPPTPDLPAFIQQLLKNNQFMEHIRAYNQMFTMTSFGAKIDHSVNKGRGPCFQNIRMPHFSGLDESILNPEIVEGLIHVLDEHNGLVRLFKTAPDRCNAGDKPSFKIRLYNMRGVRGYALLIADVLGAIMFENGPRSHTDFDVIIEFKGGPPQRINKLHQSYIGDREGIAAGSKIMLPSTFTGGPR